MTPRSRPAHWLLWLLFVVLASLALALLIPTLLGIYVGAQERAEYLHQRAIDHYKQALAYESENYTELALAELQIAVKFDPNYAPAADKLRALQITPTTNGTPVPNSATIADQLFQRAQEAIAQQQWSDAIDSLEEIRRADATFHASQVKTMLLQAYLNAGKQSISAGEIEQAQARFEAGLAIDASNAEMKSLRERAALYLGGAEATDAGIMANNFLKLYQLDPNFYDVKKRTVTALINYGDVATKQGAFCIAAREYDQAAKLDAGGDVATKLAQANTSCKQAVTAPTATPTVEATPGAGENTPVALGSFTVSSRLATENPCEGTGTITGHMRDAQGNPLANGRIQIYNDMDYRPSPFVTDAAGKYGDIILGMNPGLFHLVVLGPDGKPASGVFDVKYPGGLAKGCHWIVDWTRNS